MPRRSLPLSTNCWSLLLCVLAATACSAPRTRPVVDVVPGITHVEVTANADIDALAYSTEEPDMPPAEVVFTAVVEDATRELDDRGSRGPLEGMLGDEGPTQLDPDLGPVDLGLSLMVNLGAGQAPYDDGMPPIHAEGPGRAGFSDTMLQFSWRERLGETYGLHGTAALSRFQDIGILDGLADAEFEWFVLGVHASF